MPNVSVKLSDAVKARIDRLAASTGTTPHAFMVEALESALESSEKHSAFVEAAIRAKNEMIASGKAYDSREFIAYAKAKLRGEKASRPRLKSIKSLLKSGA